MSTQISALVHMILLSYYFHHYIFLYICEKLTNREKVLIVLNY